MISREDIATVKETARVEDIIIDSGVTLISGGSNSLKGLCPFHNERTPSFTVKPLNGYWRCFGCQKSGDVFTYLQEQEGLSFSEAVMFLAHKYNIEITEDEEEADNADRRKVMYQVNKAAAEYFHEQYNILAPDHLAITELKNRDLHMFAANSGVGYAPEGWTNLADHLDRLGFAPDDLVEAGVCNKSEKSGRLYDTFRGRLTWEIKDIQGRVIGFGARKIFDHDNGGKYINTRETLLYKKSSVLYGLDKARSVAAKDKKMYIVEGYTDVMAFHAAGIFNVIASCGTAFGDNHAGIVRRILGETGQFIFCFDGDTAGLAAARKAFDLQTPIQNSAFAVSFTGGDPCDIRLKYGNTGLLKQLSEIKPLTEFVLLHEFNQMKALGGSPEAKSNYFKAITPILLQVTDPIMREEYVKKVTLWSGTTLEAAKAALSMNASNIRQPYIEYEEVPKREELHSSADTLLIERQKQLLAMIIQYPLGAQKPLQGVSSDFFDSSLEPLGKHLLAHLEHPETLLKADVSAMPQPHIAQELLLINFPLIEQLEQAQSALVSRGITKLITGIEILRQRQMSAAIRKQAMNMDSTGEPSMNMIHKITTEQNLLRKTI